MARRLLLCVLVLASGSCFLPGAAHTPDDMVALIEAAEFNATFCDEMAKSSYRV
jgi:hypothetical protein